MAGKFGAGRRHGRHRSTIVTVAPANDGIDVPAALVVDQLTKSFGERTAFSEVSFEVAHGEVFGFLGPNGAGKTTTVRTLGTTDRPDFGLGHGRGDPAQARERRGDPSAHFDHARGTRALPPPDRDREPGVLRRSLRSASALGRRIKDALEAVNLGDRAGDLCGGLSKGLRQRVGLARTLLSDPVIMFLDEPTSGLDPVAAREVHDLIIGLRHKGVTIFLTTHRLGEAEKLCDRVAILNTTLRTIGRPEDLRHSSSRARSSSRPLRRSATLSSSSAASPPSRAGVSEGPAPTC